MKKTLLIIVATLFSSMLYAQVPVSIGRQGTQQKAALPPPVPVRTVSGIVKDSTDTTLPGAVVKLESPTDTIRTATNPDGIFIFKNVKSANFVITVTSVGYTPQIKRLKNNDAVPRLTLDPIVLKSQSTLMKEVVINGTPSITYKIDTVEYRASDYKVRPNDAVAELLKKMEGMEVGSDGTLTHQGQQVMKAKLNGKDYAGGDVANAIKNLPADIVEKIQVVDDYGDQAARTGVKDGDATKVLNITTRADRSVGTTGRLTAQAGNDDRYDTRLFVQRLNGNQQLGIIGNLANTQNGVSSAGLAGGATNGGGGGGGVGAGARGSSSPGTTQSGSPGINYRDQWSKRLQVNGSYNYNFRDNNAFNNSNGQNVSSRGPSNFTDVNTSQNNSKGHRFDMEFDLNLDSAGKDYLQIRPTFSYTSSFGLTNALTDNINHYTTGFEHQLNTSVSNNTNSSPKFGTTLLYVHVFKKPRRNLSLNSSINTGPSKVGSDRLNDYRYYLDSTQNTLVKDSVSHLLTNRNSNNTAFRTSVTYSEPVGLYSQFTFNAQMNISDTHNTALVDAVLPSGQVVPDHAQDNIFNTVSTESRLSAAYGYNNTKLQYRVGAQYIPRTLKGDKLDNSGTGNVFTTSRTDNKFIPVVYGSYAWSRTERITVTYSGTNSEPNFNYIQPFTDRTDPNNIIVGNPDLKQTFTNSYNVTYNNYFPNSRFNLSFNLNGTFIDDQISTNRLQLVQTIGTGANVTRKTINETHYVNIDGSHSYVGRYNISKQLADRRYNLALNGNVTYGYNNAYSNNILYHNTNWRFDERFGPRLSPTENIEINPSIGYDINRQFTNLVGATSTTVRTTSLAVDGRTYFLKTFQVHYTASQNFISGLTGLTNTSPLVINAGIQKEFFARRQLTVTFDMFDLLHQNNAIEQTLNPTGGYTNTQSSTLSRYFLVGVIVNLQKWSGRPTRSGKTLQRRGDGSFIY